MAQRVEFTDKIGNVKNMERPLAMRLQARKLGKITKVLRSANKNAAKKMAEVEDLLLNTEIEVEALKAEIAKMKAVMPPSNKADKEAINKVNK